MDDDYYMGINLVVDYLNPLAFYNAKAEFAVEKGEFEVYVGTDCYANNKIVIEVI